MLLSDEEEYGDLKGLADEVTEFVNQLANKDNETQEEFDETQIALPQITDYALQLKVVEWLKSKKAVPAKMTLRKNFKGLTAEEMDCFKQIFEKYGVIKLSKESLLEEDHSKIMELLASGDTTLQISKELLISQRVVQEIVDAKQATIREQTKMLSDLS